MVRAGVRGGAKKSPPGFRCRFGQTPSPVAAIVSPRLTPEDRPHTGAPIGSKRPLPLRQRQKVQKVLRCLTPKSSPRDAPWRGRCALTASIVPLLPKGLLAPSARAVEAVRAAADATHAMTVDRLMVDERLQKEAAGRVIF